MTSRFQRRARARVFALCLLPAFAASATLAQTQRSSPAPAGGASMAPPHAALPRGDHRFVQTALQGGQAEVELARMAQSRATNADVKAFAQRMEQDHGKTNDELTRMVNAKFTPMEMKPDAMHRREADRLAKASGAEFDRAYMRQMVEDHRKTVSEFQKAPRSAGDAEIKAFAARTLPTLQQHLQQAQSLHASLEGGAKSGMRSGAAPGAITATPR
jgi:putative membrane protein